MLDELRSGTMQVTLAMSDLLLKSVDVMRAMLRAVQLKQPINAQRVSDLQFDLELMMPRRIRPRLWPHRRQPRCLRRPQPAATALHQRRARCQAVGDCIPPLYRVVCARQ